MTQNAAAVDVDAMAGIDPGAPDTSTGGAADAPGVIVDPSGRVIANAPSGADTSIDATIDAAFAEWDNRNGEGDPKGDGDAAAPGDGATQGSGEGDGAGGEHLTGTDGQGASGPPQSWTAADREHWAEVPEAVQETILRREREYQAGLKTDREIAKVLEPVIEALNGTGVHPDQYVAGLIAADRYIDDQPLDAALQIVEAHGIREALLEKLASGNGGNGAGGAAPRGGNAGAAPTDNDRIARLEQQLQWEREHRAATAEFEAFANDNPDALRYREAIGAAIGMNPGLSYADALGTVRRWLGAGAAQPTPAELEARRLEAAAAKAGKATRLQLPRGSGAGVAGPASNGDLGDDVGKAMAQHGI